MQEENAEKLVDVDVEEESAADRDNMEQLTKLAYIKQIKNFLHYGKFDLTDADIERIEKDKAMKQRVSIPPSSISRSIVFPRGWRQPA